MWVDWRGSGFLSCLTPRGLWQVHSGKPLLPCVSPALVFHGALGNPQQWLRGLLQCLPGHRAQHLLLPLPVRQQSEQEWQSPCASHTALSLADDYTGLPGRELGGAQAGGSRALAERGGSRGLKSQHPLGSGMWSRIPPQWCSHPVRFGPPANSGTPALTGSPSVGPRGPFCPPDPGLQRDGRAVLVRQ